MARLGLHLRDTTHRLSEDEIINIQLRAAAGETQQDIADDYEVNIGTVRYHVDAAEKARRLAEAKKRGALARADPVAVARKLRAKMLVRYQGVTGRDLVTDLLDDREGRT